MQGAHNASSGGNDYGICCEEMHHIDITEEKTKNCKHYRSSKHGEFTYKNGSFDAIISVGSLFLIIGETLKFFYPNIKSRACISLHTLL